MELVISWFLFPALLATLSLGCGLACERAARIELARPLLPALGLAAVIVVGQFTTLADSTAELTVPVLMILALSGFWLGRSRLRSALGFDRWLLLAALGAYAVYAAPVVLSGDATFAGYIKLDDTATWMALTDRVMEHGRDIDSLAPSSYEATLAFNLADGYPVGVFIPLGVGALLTGQDVAWLVQPYMTLMAAMLTLVLGVLLRPLVQNPALRALAAFGGSLSALMIGYVLWGGIKEIAAALLIALFAALLSVRFSANSEANRTLTPSRPSVRGVIPLAASAAALLGVLSPGGAIWLVVPALLAFGHLLLSERRNAIRPTFAFLALTAAFCVPLIAGGRLLPPTSSPLTDNEARGNLAEALNPVQVAGIWPNGDFRFDPDSEVATYVLIGLALALFVAGVVYAWRSRSLGLLLYAAGSIAGFVLLSAVGSPWVAAKATAIASPAVLVLAFAAAVSVFASGRRVLAMTALALLGAGVIWSAALAYHEVRLAPREQLAELEEIGELIAASGPALMTEYQPYGVRHFLRESDAEGISELRRHPIPLRSGRSVEKGEWADTDRVDLKALLDYEVLVLRRTPEQSRPPGNYELIHEGEYYEVWRRRDGEAPAQHLPLGDGLDPGAVATCAQVAKLARAAGPKGVLIAAPAPTTLVVTPDERALPTAWSAAGRKGLVLVGSGEATFGVEVERSGSYGVWLAGTVPGRIEVLVDGRSVGSVRHQLNNSGLYLDLGAADLNTGRHELTLRYDEQPLAPGSGGPSPSVGPLVLSMLAADSLVTTTAERYRRLCGRRWDWIEAVAR